MKIKFNNVRAVAFEELAEGQLFRKPDDLDTIYLKTECVAVKYVDDDDAVNAVNLITGELYQIHDSEDVFPFEATLIEQYREV